MALLSMTSQRSLRDMLIPRDRTASRLFCSSKGCLKLFSLLFLLLLNSTLEAQVSYRNPVPRTFEYTFELAPDPAKINRSEDLKLWIPALRGWDSQKNVRILSVEPPPDATFEDPENDLPIMFWDFGKVPEAAVYMVKIRYRLESYEVHAEIDPQRIGVYDKSSALYSLYTRSTYTTAITPEVKRLAAQAVGEERNPLLQAKRILEFVNHKIKYKLLLQEGKSGVQALLNFPVTDSRTGEQYYEGACSQYSVLFVALCRALGIPARSVTGFYAGRPWLKREDLKTSEVFTKVTPDGLAAAKIYGPMGHSWAEFYLPNYGWVPVDPTSNTFGELWSPTLILSKGRDVLVGPNAPQGDGHGYGDQWMPLRDGRADIIGWGVWNLARVRNAKATVLQHSDPFPADALGEYLSYLYPEQKSSEQLKEWRETSLAQFYNAVASAAAGSGALTAACERDPQLRYTRQALVCHVLRRALGDDKFFEAVRTYQQLRTSSNEPVSTSRFKEIAERVHGSSLDWFFSRWVSGDDLPTLQLSNVSVKRAKQGWVVRGQIAQKDPTRCEAPVEVLVTPKEGDAKRRKIWLGPGPTAFEVQMAHRPERLEVDPDYDLPSIRKMPVQLSQFSDAGSDVVVIYGTAAEAEANKAAAQRFNSDYLGLEGDVVKADTDVREQDLQKKAVFLFGRPETNRISQRMGDLFPIQFRKQSFVWQGATYDRPTQAVAQVVESPFRPSGLVVLYAGLSPASTLDICDSNVYDKVASYVVIQARKELTHGDWKTDDGLRWKFE
jgi:transglutaminase-like putative cysteine protease